ncbi:MAG TPA: formate dehydrogenase accessory sulfurtransferase FdhD [Rhodocyclaceae bacterium]|nr:formate dehydrogenase accessory sulfurtransferase FdhD [Rhodocyclaceae bacterium]
MNTPTNTEVCAVEEAGLRETPWTTSVPGHITRITDQGLLEQEEELVEEVPVALVYNGISHAVMLATPNDIADFALGFSLTEGILQSPSELYDVDIVELSNGIEARLDIATERFVTLKDRRRNLTGRTGCGLCGVESLDAAVRNPAPVDDGLRVTPAAIHKALDNLSELQVVHKKTGAAHAAAFALPGGTVLYAREDVGRHNALDKLLGALAKNKVDPKSGFVVVTSRASYEMVQKTASQGIALLAAVSAPTAYARRLAEDSNVTLIGMTRGNRMTVYAHKERIVL